MRMIEDSLIFYCSKCETLDADFKITQKEMNQRSTLVTPRDFGGYVRHMVCPNCGFVISGAIRDFRDKDNRADQEYVRDKAETIKMYSSKGERTYLAIGGFEKMIDMAFKRMSEKEDVPKIILDSMCGWD